MEEKLTKALDGVALDPNQKWATQCVAHLARVLAPTSVAVKQMRMTRDVRKPDDSGPGISRFLVRNYLNYKKSGMPKRLMFYKNNEWLDYPEDVVDLVKKYFKIKKAVVEVELDGQEFVLDFLHMYHVDLKTGLQKPIAWIDEEGKCFFPEFFVGFAEKSNNISEQEGGKNPDVKEPHEIKLHLSIEINRADESKLGEYSVESNATSKDVQADGHDITNKIGDENVAIENKQDPNIDLDAYTEVVYGKMDENFVRKMFLTGMSALGINESHIVEIYRSSGRSMQKRQELFQKQADIINEVKGDANIRYAWLACSKQELSTMMECGLGHYGLSPSKCIYGSGVHLAAVTHPYVCSLYRDVDENGIKHLVLCRVIMGNMEPLRPGSDQLRPSSYEYDNGVDDILSPKYYVVWNMNMNTHIYPEFVVSFKAPLDAEGNICSNESKKNGFRHSTVDIKNLFCRIPQAKATNVPASILRTPSSRWIPFSTLFATIRNMVPPETMFLIKDQYALLMSKKISRDIFDLKLRSIVGDNVLKSAIYNIQFKRPIGGESNDSNINQE